MPSDKDNKLVISERWDLDYSSEVRKECPFYEAFFAGRSYMGMLDSRRWLLERVAEGRDSQDELWMMCKRDPLFYINAFVCTYDPRLLPKSTAIPFFTFNYQNGAILAVLRAILEHHDLLIEKSRDMGASWIMILIGVILSGINDLANMIHSAHKNNRKKLACFSSDTDARFEIYFKSFESKIEGLFRIADEF